VGERANPLNPKSRCYFVVYNDFDAAYVNAAKGNEAVTHPQPTGNQAATPQVTNSFRIGNQLSENAQSEQGDSSYNIFSEAVRDPVETEIRDPVETASLSRRGLGKAGRAESVGALLAMLERDLKNGKSLTAMWVRYLESLCGENASLDVNEPNYHRAQRLLEGYADAA
jgi:hypothetical protein